MKLPFTTEEFLDVFKKYNSAIWPMQIVLYLLGICAIFFALRKLPQSKKVIFLILSALWIWMGVVYHIVFFTAINKAAYFFGAAFVIEGVLFLHAAFSKNNISIQSRSTLNGITSWLLIAFALLLYPVLGHLQGHIYPASPTFGLPCPTTIFTFAMLLLADRVPVALLIIPFTWSLIGFSAAFSIGIKEDIGLIVSGLLSVFLIILQNKRYRKGLSIIQHSA